MSPETVAAVRWLEAVVSELPNAKDRESIRQVLDALRNAIKQRDQQTRFKYQANARADAAQEALARLVAEQSTALERKES